MKNKLIQLEIKKLFQEYNYLNTDDSYKKEVIDTYQKDFLELINKARGGSKPTPEKEEESKKVEKPKEKPLENVNDEVKSKVKKVYREIVKKTHPDKTDSEELIEIYVEATKAQEAFNLFELYNIASNLNISLELDENDLSTLKELVENKKKKLNQLESSFIWLWVHAKDETQKQMVIQLFIDKHG